MARANKYSSINFNHIYEKSLTNNPTSNTANSPAKQPSSSSSSSSSSGLYSTVSSPNAYKNHLSSSRTQSRMLVLTRPAPKPVPSVATPPLSPSPQTPPTQQSQFHIPDHSRSEPESDLISLRPLGRTGVVPSVSSPVPVSDRVKEVAAVVGSPKPDKFVPPHLRPGFAGREESPGPQVFRGKEPSQRQSHSQHQPPQGFVSPGRYGENGRPKSGGYDRKGGGGETDPGSLSRPRSSGNRPNSSGCFSESRRCFRGHGRKVVESFTKVPVQAIVLSLVPQELD